MAKIEKLEIFLASPGDVASERKAAQEVVDELNRTLPDEKGVVLQLVRWEADAYPGYGKDPQEIINTQIAAMSKYDLFIGILWNRLGTATPRARSGTEEEFRRAVQAKEQIGRPEIWFYFRSSPAKLDSADQLEQRKNVLTFRSEIEPKGLAWTYKTVAQFKDTLRTHLAKWVSSRKPNTTAPPKTVADRPREENQLLITLDADYDFIGGEEGARTAAYRFLGAVCEGKKINVVLQCEASGIADAFVKELESRSQRTPEEESRLRHGLKIQDHCREAGRLFEQGFDYIWNRSHFDDAVSLSLEEGLAEVIIGLRDQAFKTGPVVPGRTTHAKWLDAVDRRSEFLFAWHQDNPENNLGIRVDEQQIQGLNFLYHQWTGFDFSERCACHAHFLSMDSLRRVLVPSIALDLVERYKDKSVPEDLSNVKHWLVARSHPQKVFERFTWEQMLQKESQGSTR